MTELPPPPPGGYPPPPAPDGGGVPPPAADYRPSDPYGVGAGYNVGEAFSWAWNKFTQNALPLIVGTVVLALVVSVLQSITVLLTSALDPSFAYEDYGFGLVFVTFGIIGIIVSVLGSLVTLVLSAAVTSAYIGGVLDIADGRPVTIESFFKPRNVVSVVIASVLVGIITTIGTLLCIVPGVIASVFLMFTSVALVERNLPPTEGMKASYELTKGRFGDAFLALVVMVAITLVGALACGIGLLVAIPVAALFLVYTYRRFSGGNVASTTAQAI
jgi:uncharacterized membrane protein